MPPKSAFVMYSIDFLTMPVDPADNAGMTADRISVRQLQDLLAAGEPVTVLDVRSAEDLDWAIPGSIHLDVYHALKAGALGPLADVDRSGPVVTVCGVGRTAAIATEVLRARGIEASTLAGGMQAWSRSEERRVGKECR